MLRHPNPGGGASVFVSGGEVAGGVILWSMHRRLRILIIVLITLITAITAWRLIEAGMAGL